MAASVAKSNSKGLDSALWKKIDAKFDRETAKQCLLWVKSVTGENFQISDNVSSEEFMDNLQSGYLLCLLVQKIEPQCWVKIKQRKFKPKSRGGAFVFRNQIEVMTKAMRLIGVRETDIFTSQDLYSKENPNNVITGIFQLNAMSQKYKAFDGPYMEGGFKASTENKRVFSEETIRKGRTAIPKWSEGSLKMDSGRGLDSAGIVKTAGSEDWVSSAAVPNWSKGSIAVKSNKRVDKIMKNVANEDWQASEEVPKMFQPKQMGEKRSNFDSAGIIKHA